MNVIQKGIFGVSEKVKPSLIRMIQSDYLALLGVLVPIVSFVLYVSVAYFGFFPGFRGHDPIQGTEGAPLFFYLFIAGFVVGIPLATWRIHYIQQMFAKCEAVFGHVTSLSFFRDRGNVQYTYTFKDQEYHGANAIMKTARTQQLESGSQINLLVDPENPARALIRDLYI